MLREIIQQGFMLFQNSVSSSLENKQEIWENQSECIQTCEQKKDDGQAGKYDKHQYFNNLMHV